MEYQIKNASANSLNTVSALLIMCWSLQLRIDYLVNYSFLKQAVIYWQEEV